MLARRREQLPQPVRRDLHVVVDQRDELRAGLQRAAHRLVVRPAESEVLRRARTCSTSGKLAREQLRRPVGGGVVHDHHAQARRGVLLSQRGEAIGEQVRAVPGEHDGVHPRPRRCYILGSLARRRHQRRSSRRRPHRAWDATSRAARRARRGEARAASAPARSSCPAPAARECAAWSGAFLSRTRSPTAGARRSSGASGRPCTTRRTTPRRAFAGPVVVTVHDLSTLLYPETQDAGARAALRAQAPAARPGGAGDRPYPARSPPRSSRASASPPERVRVIHHGVDARFTPGGRRAAGFVLYAGDAGPRKGLATLRAALPEGTELKLAGPGHGYVADEELLALYRTRRACWCCLRSTKGSVSRWWRRWPAARRASPATIPALRRGVRRSGAAFSPRRRRRAPAAPPPRARRRGPARRALATRHRARAGVSLGGERRRATLEVYREAAR